ncbi:hypothetical protein AMTRI_Chr06g198030 [Amborella trichopoda]
MRLWLIRKHRFPQIPEHKTGSSTSIMHISNILVLIYLLFIDSDNIYLLFIVISFDLLYMLIAICITVKGHLSYSSLTSLQDQGLHSTLNENHYPICLEFTGYQCFTDLKNWN